MGPWTSRFSGDIDISLGGIIDGNCLLEVEGAPSVLELKRGDCFVVAGKRPYRIGTDLNSRPLPAEQLFSDDCLSTRLTNPTAGVNSSLFLGAFTLGESHPDLLLNLLPPVIHLPAASGSASTLLIMLEQLVKETAISGLGSKLIGSSLAQILFVQVLREFALSEASITVGWFRAYSDRATGMALRLMHGDVRKQWTLPEIASAVGMSRSGFASRFKLLVGVAPLDYLLRWRMQLAARLLRTSKRTVSAVSDILGYSSESAFSSAFKRVMGHSPKQYRVQVLTRCETDQEYCPFLGWIKA